MSELTPGGWPFVTKDDFAIEWPVVSETIAKKLDTRASIFATPAARDAAIPSPTAGMTCFVTSLLQWQGWTGTRWINIRVGQRIEAGTRVAVVAGDGSMTITFTAPFAETPHVVGMPGDLSGLSTNSIFQGIAISATQARFSGWAAGTTGRVNYIAIGTEILP